MNSHFKRFGCFGVFLLALFMGHAALASSQAAVADVDEIDALLSAREFERAGALLRRVPAVPAERWAAATEAQLRVEIARARWSAASGDPQATLAQRQQLDAVLTQRFGLLHALTFENRNALAMLLTNGGRLQQAIALMRELVAAMRAAPPGTPTVRAVVVSQLNLALALTQAGQDDEAVALGQQALLDAQRLGADPQVTGSAQFAVAQVLRVGGRAEEALALARAAYLGFRAREGEGALRTIEAARELALATSLAGDADTALQLGRRAAEQAIQTLGAKHRTSLHARGNLGDLALRAQQIKLARKTLGELVPDALDVLGPGDIISMSAMSLLINTGSVLNDPSVCRYLPILEAETAETEAKGSTAVRLRPNLLLNQGECARLNGDLPRALRYVEQALAMLLAARPTEFDTLYHQRLLARLYLEAGDKQRAAQVLQAFVSAAERQRSDSALAWRTRFASWVESQSIEAGFRTLAVLRAANDEAAPAFEVAERARARILLDRDFVAAIQRSLPAQQRAQAEALRKKMSDLELQLALQSDPAQRIAIDAQRDEARKALSSLAANVRGDNVFLAGFDARVLNQTLDRALNADELFVQFVADRDDIAILGRTRAAQPFVVAVTQLPGLDAHIRAARRALGGDAAPGRLWRLANGQFNEGLARPPDAVARVTDQAALETLSAALLQPLAPHLANRKRLIISPDGPLAVLPFEALPLRGRPLSAQLDVSYTHSANMFIAARQRLIDYRRTPRRAALLIGAPQPALSVQPQLDERLRDMQWPLLAGVNDELDAIARVLPGRIDRVHDESAQKARIKLRAAQGELARYRVLHVAAHAWYADGAPDLASLVLGDAPSADPLAGYLTATELRGIELRSDLVVLSACTSTGGAVQSGEGLTGLVHALFMAGTAGAVVSLWPVADQPTAELMQAFYRRIARGIAPGTALTQAKRELAQRGFAPRDWAAFIYYGAG